MSPFRPGTYIRNTNQIHKFRSNELISHVADKISVDICDSPITETEVVLSLKKLKYNKAAGIDGIASEFYKYTADELAMPFCSIFNYIFDKGEDPTQWAESLIMHFTKKEITPIQIIIER